MGLPGCLIDYDSQADAQEMRAFGHPVTRMRKVNMRHKTAREAGKAGRYCVIDPVASP
jgi:hypothetical protein